MSRAERREQDEKRKKEEAAKKAAQEAADRLKQEEAKHIIERAQLEEEEIAVQKRLECKRKLQEMAEEKEMQETQETQETQGVPAKVSATSEKQWKEYLGLKARRRTQIINLTRTLNKTLSRRMRNLMRKKCLR